MQGGTEDVLVVILHSYLALCYRIGSSKDQDLDIVMMEQFREAELLQDPNGYVRLFLAWVLWVNEAS